MSSPMDIQAICSSAADAQNEQQATPQGSHQPHQEDQAFQQQASPQQRVHQPQNSPPLYRHERTVPYKTPYPIYPTQATEPTPNQTSSYQYQYSQQYPNRYAASPFHGRGQGQSQGSGPMEIPQYSWNQSNHNYNHNHNYNNNNNNASNSRTPPTSLPASRSTETTPHFNRLSLTLNLTTPQKASLMQIIRDRQHQPSIPPPPPPFLHINNSPTPVPTPQTHMPPSNQQPQHPSSTSTSPRLPPLPACPNVLLHSYNEYLAHYPLGEGERPNGYYMNLLANQRVESYASKGYRSAVRYAKARWWRMYEVGDLEEVIRLAREERGRGGGV